MNDLCWCCSGEFGDLVDGEEFSLEVEFPTVDTLPAESVGDNSSIWEENLICATGK